MEKQDKSKLKKKEETSKNPIKSCFSMVTKWFEIPLVRNAIIISGLFALIIHILYSIPAPFEFLVHKWEAGDILTYVSTIALSLLAVWQNQKFKEENDKAQETMERQNNEAQARLERINIEANELSIIGRIIDQEDQYLTKLEEAAHAFLNSSSGSTLLAAINKAVDRNDPMVVSGADKEMSHAYNRIKSTYLLGMKTDGTELVVLMDAFDALYEKASTIFSNIYKKRDYDFTFIDEYSLICDKAENALDVFLFERRKIMYRVLTEKMSLEQVRAIYRTIEGNIARYGDE